MLRVELLGERRLRHGASDAGPGIQYRKAWALLGYLVLEGGRRHPREQLAELLWPDLPPASARTNLRQVLANLHRVLDACGGAGWLVAGRDDVGLVARPGVAIDVLALARAVDTADTEALLALPCAGPDGGGEFLAGLVFDDCPRFSAWLQMERSRLAMISARALRLALEAHAAAGRPTAAIAIARRLVALDPWDEGVQRQWMAALAADGRFDEALAAYDRHAAMLAAELGGVPSAALSGFRDVVEAASRGGAGALPLAPVAAFVGPRQWVCGIACRLHAADDMVEAAANEVALRARAAGALVLSARPAALWLGVPAGGPPGTMGAAAIDAARIAAGLASAFDGRVAAALCPGLVQWQGTGTAMPLGNPDAAATLLDHALPGTVLVCGSLFPDLYEAFALHPLPAGSLPGVEHPPRVWQLGREGECAGEVVAEDGRPATLAGVPARIGLELLTLRLDEAPRPPGDAEEASAWLTVIEGGDRGKRVGVAEAPVVVGRSPDADLQLPRRTVSRHHCVVWREAESYRLRDLGATNRTCVNGLPIIDARLAEGDVIAVGDCLLRLGRDD